MTKEEFQKLGTKMHYKVFVEWNGKKWRMTQTIQASGTCMLNNPDSRRYYPLATSYERVTLLGNG